MKQEKTILIELILRWFARISAIFLSLFSLLIIISIIDHIYQSKDSSQFILILITLICLIISYTTAFFNEKLGGAMSILFSIILIIFSNPYWVIAFYPVVSVLFILAWVFSRVNTDIKKLNKVH